MLPEPFPWQLWPSLDVVTKTARNFLDDASLNSCRVLTLPLFIYNITPTNSTENPIRFTYSCLTLRCLLTSRIYNLSTPRSFFYVTCSKTVPCIMYRSPNFHFYFTHRQHISSFFFLQKRGSWNSKVEQIVRQTSSEWMNGKEERG